MFTDTNEKSTQNSVLYQLFERFTRIWKTGKKRAGAGNSPVVENDEKSAKNAKRSRRN